MIPQVGDKIKAKGLFEDNLAYISYIDGDDIYITPDARFDSAEMRKILSVVKRGLDDEKITRFALRNNWVEIFKTPLLKHYEEDRFKIIQTDYSFSSQIRIHFIKLDKTISYTKENN